MSKRRKRKKSLNPNMLKVFIVLSVLIIIFNIAPNYVEDNEYYIEEKINLIIDNNNVTKNLKHDLFITNKNVIYMSIEDIADFFDNSINYNKEKNEILTIYGEKKVKLPLNKNIMQINSREQDILSGAIEKENVYYIPITSMGKIYEVDIEYIKEKQILLVDSLIRKLVKADISKRCDVKYQPTVFSKTIDKLERADKVICIEHLDNNWTQIRTKNGKIGYVKTKLLHNEIYIRDDLIL